MTRDYIIRSVNTIALFEIVSYSESDYWIDHFHFAQLLSFSRMHIYVVVVGPDLFNAQNMDTRKFPRSRIYNPAAEILISLNTSTFWRELISSTSAVGVEPILVD